MATERVERRRLTKTQQRQVDVVNERVKSALWCLAHSDEHFEDVYHRGIDSIASHELRFDDLVVKVELTAERRPT